MTGYDKWIQEIGNTIRKAADELDSLAQNILDELPDEEDVREEDSDRYYEVRDFAGEMQELASDLADTGYGIYTTEVRYW